LTNPNFLILDEPTNDFDIFTMNILEDFLMGYQGCLLIVSHDRYFMDKVADTLFILNKDGAISGFVGKCSEYIEYEKEKEAEEAASQKPAENGDSNKRAASGDSLNSAENDSTSNTNNQSGSETSKKKLSFKEQREFDQLEKDIETLENRKAELEEIMSAADRPFEEIDKANKEYQTLSASLDAKYARWEELAI
ncbi:MAG: ABC transporter ATP-binding protein, partial [Treponema sp.]|nr:ABC transporter ATP-binding protein [Treponema sp.]